MNTNKQNNFLRWIYLGIGIFSMMFAGIIYAWSILKAPFEETFNWNNTYLANNFTITMCSFCIGGLLGSRIAKKIGHKLSIFMAAVLSAVGFILTSFLTGSSVIMLFISYGIIASLGIGIAYNVIISTISSWFPDKKGICSGALMMGFGLSALVLGKLADYLFKQENIGWRTTFIILGTAIGIVLLITSIIINKKPSTIINNSPKNSSNNTLNFSTKQMFKTSSFWLTFIYLICLTAVGSSVISFAKDLVLEVKASDSLAVSLVGVLSICNGLGRILIGTFFDILGQKKTMFLTNIITILASIMILTSLLSNSLALCIIGLCLTGISYGGCPTIASAATLYFYGEKYFPTNMAFMTFNIMGGSLIASISSILRNNSDGFVLPFIVLLILTCIALVLNFIIKKPNGQSLKDN